ncbi:hypothetical protein [Actinoplanes sp. GCM10030250]
MKETTTELAEMTPAELQELLEDELGLAVGDTGCAAWAAPIRQD